MKINGSCQCGKITFCAEANPENVHLCHCNECQAISGSPFRWSVTVSESDYELLSGAPKIFVKKISEEGFESHQVFCPDCASPLYATSNRPGPRNFHVRLGTVEERAQFVPRKQYWHEENQSWIYKLTDVPAVNGE